MEKQAKKAARGLENYGRRSFSSLGIYNYRLYFIGQAISISGNWLQIVALSWLVLQLTGSGTMLGILAAAQFLPMLLFGAYGGVIADRFPKRKLLYATQTVAAILGLVLAALVFTDTIQVWMVFALAIAQGFVQVVDNPTRQAFIIEMVGPEQITNAVSLHSIVVNIGRIAGPLFAAGLIAGFGLAWCFLINGLSFLIVLGCLLAMRSHDLQSRPPAKPERGQLQQGLRYVWRTPVLRNVLIMMALVGCFAYEFPVVLPLLAIQTFQQGASGFAVLMAAMGGGSLLGALITAGRGNPSPKRLLRATLALGLSMLLVAIAPTFIVAVALMVVVGFWSTGFTAFTNSTLQLNAAPEMRGRVMSLWSVGFLGSTPIGGPIIGWISQHGSPRLGLAVGGMSAVVACVFGVLAVRHHRHRQAVEPDIAEAVSY